MSDESILNSTKQKLGLLPDYDVFDAGIIDHINTVFATLTQLGIGPPDGYGIEDASNNWSEFIGDDNGYNPVKTYMYLRVRMLFDPPATSFALDAMKEQILQMEWRLSVHRETTQWVDPTPVEVREVTDEPVVIDGGIG